MAETVVFRDCPVCKWVVADKDGRTLTCRSCGHVWMEGK